MSLWTTQTSSNRLPLAPLLALRRQLRHLDADLEAAIAARLVAQANGQPEAPAEDRLLTPEEAAPLLGVTVTWLYRHAKHLPFARRLSRKCLRFSGVGLRKWQVTRRG